MSTKTIAVESSVYARLASAKRESESFTKTIARLLDTSAEAHTGAHIASLLPVFGNLESDDAARMNAVVTENRAGETWERHDLG